MMAVKELEVPIYRQQVLFVSCESDMRSLVKYAMGDQAKKILDHLDGAGGYTMQVHHNGYVFWAGRSRVDAGTLTHEAVHAACMILKTVGIRAGLTNDEPIAYVAGWLVEQFNEKAEWVPLKKYLSSE